MKSGLKGLLLFICFTLAMSLPAQQSQVWLDPDADFRNGLNLFDQQKYGAAQHCFERVIANASAENFLLKTEAEYYSSLCALELFHRDAEMRLKTFMEDHPESPRIAKANFSLGKYNYRKKKYEKAAAYFENLEKHDLSPHEIPEFYFKRGYSYFDLEQNDKAKKDFYEVTDTGSTYYVPATYFLSHILYHEKRYEKALEGFLKITGSENFGPIVPYYIAQIYYLQGKYGEVIAYAPSLLDSTSTKRGPEIARIIGESYYKMGKYNEAVPYLKRYEKARGYLSKTDNYQMGFAMYKSGDYANAVLYFQAAIDRDDSLAQNAYYHLADCSIRLGRKSGARPAFRKAANMKFDKEIREDALFQYARLCLELSYNPFNEAIRALNTYIAEYPTSPRIDKAHEYLVNIYLTTKNYKDGLKSIEKITKVNELLKPIHQKLAYNYAVELFNNNDYDGAIRYFDQSFAYPSDRNINALGKFWKAEAWYRKGETEKDNSHFTKAIDLYKSFLSEPAAVLQPQYNDVQYAIGYAYFQQMDYASATNAFRKYVSVSKDNPEKLCNAYIRLGDCYFITKDPAGAAEYYQEALNVKTAKRDKDYALYQRSRALGYLKKNEAKIKALEELLAMAPSTPYAPEAKFELGKTWFEMGQPDKAQPWFLKVLNEHPGSLYTNKAMNSLGQIHFNRKEEDKALEYFEKVVQNNPKGEDANEAISQAGTVFKSKKDVDGMNTWMKKYGVEIPASSLDSLEYKNCMDDYFEKNCKASVQGFHKYIQKYPDGIFILDANFYKAECENLLGNADLALGGYNFVIDHSKGKTPNLESSLARASRIYFKAKNYEAALRNYEKLSDVAEDPKNFFEARQGQMRCSFLMKNYSLAVDYSKNVLINEKATKENRDEAHFTYARAELERNNLDTAYREFNWVAKSAKNVMRAESKYSIAYIHFLKKDYKKTERMTFDVINSESAHNFWVGKSFLLLADNFLAQADTFQAKTTLQAYIDNSDVPELKTLAEEKLKAIEEAEKMAIPVRKEEEITIPVNEENRKLMEEKKEGGGNG